MPQIVRGYRNLPESAKGAVVAIGNFDGLHKGHQALIRFCVERAKAMQAPSAVMGFYPHPRQFFARKETACEAIRLMTLRLKCQMLAQMGVDNLVMVPFNAAFSALSALAFVQQVLHQHMQVRHVVVGHDFIYGHKRQGNSEILVRDAAALGIGVTAIDPVLSGEIRCSSSVIRAALRHGDLTGAESLLGHPHMMTGRVLHGDKRGREIGFPTANLDMGHLCCPAFGVYAVSVRILSGAHAGDAWLPAVANIGLRPTFGGTRPRLEVHLFEGGGNLYGAQMQVRFHHYIRPEHRFDSLEALRVQIAQDCEVVKDYFASKAYDGAFDTVSNNQQSGVG